MDTKDLILRKAVFSDWPQIWRHVWSREETAKYMFWDVTSTEAEAVARMERTLKFQRANHAWFVCRKDSGEAVGFAGVMAAGEGTYEDIGIALGPEHVGRGYGKQILNALTEYVFTELGGTRFIVSCRSENAPSRGMILACGFRFTHREQRTDPRNGQPCILEFYEKTALPGND